MVCGLCGTNIAQTYRQKKHFSINYNPGFINDKCAKKGVKHLQKLLEGCQ